MSDRPSDAVNDRMLEQEIEALLSSEPSPEFLSRVRARVALEPIPGRWRTLPALAAGVAFAAAAVFALVVLRDEPPPGTPRLSARPFGVARDLPASAVSGNVSQTTVRRATVTHRPAVSEAVVSTPAKPIVVIYAPEAAAWRRLLMDVSAGRIDIARLGTATTVTSPGEASDPFAIEPVVIEPLTPAVSEQGAHP